MTTHVRYAPRHLMPHSVDNRSLITTCGLDASNWAILINEKEGLPCEKCAQLNSTLLEITHIDVPGEAPRNALARSAPTTPMVPAAWDPQPESPTPWTQDNSLAVIRDAIGRSVSFAGESTRIVRAVNFETEAYRCMERMTNAIIKVLGPKATVADTKVLMQEAQAAIVILTARKAETNHG